jgi:two-component system, OmpR family, phosphate regulon response regulator PhoB
MKILIVEDHPACRDLLTFFLRNMGFETVVVETGDKAIACAATLQPDLIFIDLRLPDINGVEMTAALKRNTDTTHIPIVVISALPASIWGSRAGNAGATAYLTKPASALELRQTIEKLTGPNQELRS